MVSVNDIENKLQILEPYYLEILDQTALHSSHKERLKKLQTSDNKSSATHLKIKIGSSKFKGLSEIEKHRIINNLLKQELKGDLHALSLSFV